MTITEIRQKFEEAAAIAPEAIQKDTEAMREEIENLDPSQEEGFMLGMNIAHGILATSIMQGLSKMIEGVLDEETETEFFTGETQEERVNELAEVLAAVNENVNENVNSVTLQIALRQFKRQVAQEEVESGEVPVN